MIARHRIDASLTQSALAERVGVTQQTVSSWERSDTLPSDPDVIAALAVALQVDDLWLESQIDDEDRRRRREAAVTRVSRHNRDLERRSRLRIVEGDDDPDSDPPNAGAPQAPLEMAALSGKLEQLSEEQRRALEALIDSMLED